MKRTRVSLICRKHGYKQMAECDECAKEITQRVEMATFHPWKKMVYEDICETPILIESKQHLKRECKKHNVRAARLM